MPEDPSEKMTTEKNMLHELGHYYQDEMATRYPTDFLPLISSDKVRAEGFAVILSALLSNSKRTLVEHHNQMVEDGVSYLEAAARYIETLAGNNVEQNNNVWFQQTADMIRKIDSASTNEEKINIGEAAYDRLRNLAPQRSVEGIRCSKLTIQLY